MKAKASDWYRHGWTLDIKEQSWVEDTPRQVEFLTRTLGLTGRERVLDLACGFGRHALALARMGCRVTGVDITPAYVDDANRSARAENLNAEFLCMDVREVAFEDEFDVVMNMADGAIGYLETDEENLKIFDVVARALRRGGKHFMDIGNAAHAEKYYPKRWWECGEKSLALAAFEWIPETRRMLFGGFDVPYGQPAPRPEIEYGDPTRLYATPELREIWAARGMEIVRTFSNFEGAPESDREPQLLVYSVKK
ncbi:MAG: class I SAM-dependent methyltransferase [Eubacteriales bacterium]|nr:class I SAM-dependent methyltransferase [Eubacteriales bacterium]